MDVFAGCTKAWIIGAGTFGRRAIASLGELGIQEISVVDRRLPPNLPPSVDACESDGVEWLSSRLRSSTDGADTIVIPALPLHLAAEWLMNRLRSQGFTLSRPSLDDSFVNALPNGLRLSASSAALSHATFRCPPDCSEPRHHCTATGRRRPPPLYRLLEEKAGNGCRPLIIRSRQIAAGVGGFRAEELWRIYRRARRLPGKILLAGTACKCHGIIDTFAINRDGSP